jgi:small GTP-binding protein
MDTRADDKSDNNKSDKSDKSENNIKKIDPIILDERNVKGYDYLLKFIVVGNSCVGKSNLTLRFTKDDFDPSNESTIGAEYYTKIICLDSKVYKIQIWDTAGQDTFKTITRSYYRNSIGCIVAFDVSNRDSFNAVRTWYEELLERSEPYTGKQSIVMVGNKIDKSDARSVTHEEASALATELGIEYYEASAKTGYNVRDIFQKMVLDINEKINNQELSLKIGTDGVIQMNTLDKNSYNYIQQCSC